MAPAVQGAVLLIFGSMIWQTAFGCQLFWRVDGSEGCLADGEQSFCAQNVRINRAWQDGVDLEVLDSDGVVVLYLSFRYLGAEGNSQYNDPDGPFALLTTSEIGSLNVSRYRVQLGDGSDSAAGVVVITSPAVFEMGIVGGSDKTRTEFIEFFRGGMEPIKGEGREYAA